MTIYSSSPTPIRKPTAVLRVLVLLTITPVALATEAARETTEPLTLERAVAIALANSPDLGALSARSSALEAVPPQAGALPDPMLSLNAMNLPTDTFDFEQEPMTQLQIGVSQSVPFPGKRRLLREAAVSEFKASQAHVKEGTDVLIGQVRSAWWRVFSTDRALEIVERNQQLMRDFIEIAQTKYTVGDGLQQDVLLAQLELSKLLDRESRLTGGRRGATARLNGLLDRTPNQPVHLARAPASTDLPDLPSETDLLAQAQASRALLDVEREKFNAADARVDLAERDRYPDLRIAAGYGFRQGDDPLRGKDRADLFSVLLSVNLPIYAASKQTMAIEQRVNEREAHAFALSSVARRIETEIGQRMADYEAAREQVRLLNGAIIPQAEQTVASMLAGYQVNEVDFLNVINGQLTLYNAQINYWTALADAKSALAGIAAAVGKESLYE
jgi:cobalt-zinc-cadmium efflux system outer membrane protein